MRRTLAKPLVTGSIFLAMATMSILVSGLWAGLGFGLIAGAYYAQDFLVWRRSGAGRG